MSLIKSKRRVADHGEVFTPLWLEDASLRHTGIQGHAGLEHFGLYATVVGRG